MVYDAVSLHQGRKLSMESFKQAIDRGTSKVACPMPQSSDIVNSPELTFPKQLPPLKQAADLWVAEAMRRSQGNQNIAARLLGISPRL